jgi:DNA-binding transcriptional MerR regulator
MRERALSIGQLAAASGCTVQTIRYYEQVGLMPKPARTAGNQRAYDRRHLERLGFIRHGRELGFPLHAVRDLLALADDPEHPCGDADAIARTQLEIVRRRMARLRALEAELERMLAQCQGERIGDCRVIEVLADHGQCLAASHDPAPGDEAGRAAAPRVGRPRRRPAA